jgi:hypothetical protein
VTGFYLIDSLVAGEGEVFAARLKQLVLMRPIFRPSAIWTGTPFKDCFAQDGAPHLRSCGLSEVSDLRVERTFEGGPCGATC